MPVLQKGCRCGGCTNGELDLLRLEPKIVLLIGVPRLMTGVQLSVNEGRCARVGNADLDASFERCVIRVM